MVGHTLTVGRLASDDERPAFSQLRVEVPSDRHPRAIVAVGQAKNGSHPTFCQRWVRRDGIDHRKVVLVEAERVVPMSVLAPTLLYDFRVVVEMNDQLGTLRAVAADVLLMGASKSPMLGLARRVRGGLKNALWVREW
jgi:hypothetical protein